MLLTVKLENMEILQHIHVPLVPWNVLLVPVERPILVKPVRVRIIYMDSLVLELVLVNFMVISLLIPANLVRHLVILVLRCQEIV